METTGLLAIMWYFTTSGSLLVRVLPISCATQSQNWVKSDLCILYHNVDFTSSVAMWLRCGGIFKSDYCKFKNEYQCKNFENRLAFGKVMDKSPVSCFLVHSVHYKQSTAVKFQLERWAINTYNEHSQYTCRPTWFINTRTVLSIAI